MGQRVINAHDILSTRLCQAANCEQDAEPAATLCARCAKRRRRGLRVPIHKVEQPRQPDPDTELICGTCSTWKPDAAFSRQAAEPHRRQRHRECKACCTIRRREYRERLSPEKREAQKQRESEYKKRMRAAAAAMNAATRGIHT